MKYMDKDNFTGTWSKHCSKQECLKKLVYKIPRKSWQLVFQALWFVQGKNLCFQL